MVEKAHPVTARYQPLLDTCESFTLDFLQQHLDEMFTKVEPVMIDFASKAENDNAQVLFFDAITEVKKRQSLVTDEYLGIIRDGFNRFMAGRPIHYPRPVIETDTPDQIGIVEDDDLEVHIAIQSMITKARNNSHQHLYQLGQRLAVMRRGKKPVEQDIPASPAHIATAFQTVANQFPLEQKLLLILFMLFERNLVAKTEALYPELNRILSEAGIYPNLAPILDLNQRASTTDTSDPAAEKERGLSTTENPSARQEPLTNEDFAVGQEVFDAILSLLTERRRLDPRFKDHPEYVPGGNLDQLRSRPQMVAAMNQVGLPERIDLSIYEEADREGLSAAGKDAHVTPVLKQRITDEREKIYQELDTNTIPTADLDTIELVGLLFEHILDDPDLASLTKTLICHLHTPYLKVAVIDQAFLTEPEHIARKLLNLVVDAGRRWVDENNLQAGIYNVMQKMIQKIMAEFRDDLALFENQYETFLQQVQSLEQRTRILEERTKEATRGKDRLEYARAHSDEVLNELCYGSAFFPPFKEFLYSLWKNYMILMLLRDPEIEQQREWSNVLTVIRGIIRINNGYRDAGTRAWMARELPSLRRNIEVGLEFMGNTNHPQYRALLGLIERLQEGPVPEETDQRTPIQVARGSRRSGSESGLSGEEKRVLETVKQTRIGTWFEFDTDGGEVARVKLSWYSPITNNHMFIDRFGHKAFILPTHDLIRKLMVGSARMVAPNRFPFVDHALNRIYRLLRPD
ncbi:MAG: DUF1631 domain-containing protein [Sedimenticola sp.]|nr:DUF1631 domain-containing protein [Sedimenticola sp.]